MGKCLELNVEGVDKPVLVQIINQGGDVKAKNVDLQQMAGGVGLCNALTAFTGFPNGDSSSSSNFPLFEGDNTVWGPKKLGGFDNTDGCASIPSYPDGVSAVTSFR